ncbi:signal peptidase I [Mucilaginibacter sp. PAMB04274]|uniref:signal peptidase I n=1 Tax=Mucilaginibacter sp. PAMB04274 TaxID=3138568 RepID=UPI0031F6DDA2
MKIFIALLLFCGVLFAGFVGMRYTNALNWYYVTTESSEPTFKAGNIVFVSRFKKPHPGSYICYKGPGGSIYTHRCVAIAKDIIELRDGNLYRNGKFINEPYTASEYLIANSKADSLAMYFDRAGKTLTSRDSAFSGVSLSNQELKTLHLTGLQRLVSAKGFVNEGLYKPFVKAGYNEDNFGPVTVPANSCFVLGDNRHWAMDSRYLGFITADMLIGTVLN